MTKLPALPVFRAFLPKADRLQPYLREIDQNNWYTNFGPLHERFVKSLETHLGTMPGTVACTANATLGVVLALKASGAETGGLCLMPAWTFSATAAAVVNAGLEPRFIDVDAETWCLDPDHVRTALDQAHGACSAIVVVPPFGAAVDIKAWDRLSEETGIAVVIDAAEGFDSIQVGRSATVVSLHAAKTFGIGEGGYVVSSDQDLVGRVRSLSDYGRLNRKSVEWIGLNAKLSEYAAAVGLAMFEDWTRTRKSYADLKASYLESLGRFPDIIAAPVHGQKWITSTFNVAMPTAVAPIMERLDRHGIDTRQWWDKGCHRQPAFMDFSRDDLPNTDWLAAHVVGLPFHLGMTEQDVNRVVDVLSDIFADTP